MISESFNVHIFLTKKKLQHQVKKEPWGISILLLYPTSSKKSGKQ